MRSPASSLPEEPNHTQWSDDNFFPAQLEVAVGLRDTGGSTGQDSGIWQLTVRVIDEDEIGHLVGIPVTNQPGDVVESAFQSERQLFRRILCTLPQEWRSN